MSKYNYTLEVALAIEADELLDIQEIVKELKKGNMDILKVYTPINSNKSTLVIEHKGDIDG